MFFRYLTGLTPGRQILWCYLIWYLAVGVRYFDPDPKVWATAAGLSVVVGLALIINASEGGAVRDLNRWQSFRFFLIPFCVSSFAALVKGHGFFLIFPPSLLENAKASVFCLLFCLVVNILRRFDRLRRLPLGRTRILLQSLDQRSSSRDSNGTPTNPL